MLSWKQRGRHFDLAITGRHRTVRWYLHDEEGSIDIESSRDLLDDCVGRPLAFRIGDLGELIGIAAPKAQAR